MHQKWLILTAVVCLMVVICSGCAGIYTPPSTETGGGTLSNETESAKSSLIAELESNAQGDMMYLDFLNIGKADCMVLRMDGLVIVIDAGEESDQTQILSYLNGLNISRIDYLILTHFDNDHVGSAPVLIENYEIGEIVTPNYYRDSTYYSEIQTLSSEKNITVSAITEDLVIKTANGTVTVNPTHLYDDQEIIEAGEDSLDNDYSLITTVIYGSTRVLLMGDAEKDRINEFMDNNTVSVYQLIKLPHHGSYYKVLKTLLTKTVPSYVVSCVENSTDMDEDLISVLEDKGITSYVTYEGTVHLASDGKTTVTEQD